MSTALIGGLTVRTPNDLPFQVACRLSWGTGVSSLCLHQSRPPSRLVVAFGAASVVASIIAPATAKAQAWVAEPGSLTVGLDYGFGWSDQIEEGELVIPGGNLIAQTFSLSAELVPLERLAVRANVPLYLVYWSQQDLIGAHGRYDDGNPHLVLQDFSWEARYMLLQAPVAVTPVVGMGIPMVDYETRGNAAVGRHLLQGYFGLNVGFILPWVPDLYGHARYVFSIVEAVDISEETEQFDQNRSELNVQIGYFFLPQLQAYLTTDLVIYHGGINFVDWPNLSETLRVNHDVLLQEELFFVGGGVGYQVTDQLALDLSIRVFALGDNTRRARIITLSASWNDYLW